MFGRNDNSNNDANDDEEEREKLHAPADFDGPTRDRHCTDLLMLLILATTWAGMLGVGVYAVINGDPRLVLNPLDYDGNVCGTNYGVTDMTNFPNLYYINSYTGGVCVETCPRVSDYVRNATNNNTNNDTTANGEETDMTATPLQPRLSDVRTMVTYSGVWQTEGAFLPLDFVKVGNYSNSSDAIACTDQLCFPTVNDPTSSWTSVGVARGWGFSFYAGDTYDVLMRCYYTNEALVEMQSQVNPNADKNQEFDSGIQAVNEAYAFWTKLYSDLYIARVYVLGFGFGMSVGLSFLYVFLLRIPCVLNILVWTSILLTIVMFAISGYYAGQLADDWNNEDPQTIDATTINVTIVAGYVLYGIAALLVLLTCYLRRSISMAIQAVKQASRAINHMPLIITVPILQATTLVAFAILFLYFAVHVASLGEVQTQDIPLDVPGGVDLKIAVRTFVFDDFVQNCAWYLLFVLFWTANLITAMGDMSVALAVAHWYFARNKRVIGSWTVFTSVGQVIWYHTGTCAYGSLLLAIVQIIRAIIARAQRAAKRAPGGMVARVLLCCCQCCFCMLECCLKFISKNAYIQTAIFSTAFCKSCRKAFFLIARNAGRVAAVSYVSAAILIIGKLFISAVTTGIGYYIIAEDIGDELYSVGGPVAVIFLISYWVSDFFMDVFDMAITCILQCLIADEEMFEGDGLYAEKDFQRWMDKHRVEDEND